MRLGSFCTGYGGLDLAVAEVYDVRHVWHAEIDPDASKVLAAHWPDVPNHGDLRATDWSSVEPVDVLTAGFPCQPVSAAGRRKGITDERWLFDDIADAVGRMVTRPRLLVLENVPGLLTANRGNAMARVVHGLAALGYVGRYRVFRASDVGAAHQRERVFIVAHLPDSHSDAVRQQSVGVSGRGGASLAGGDRAGSGVLSLLPTPRVAATRTGRSAILRSASAPSLDQALELARGELPRELHSLDEAPASWRLLPTPAARDGDGRGEGSPDYWQRRRDDLGRTNGAPLGATVALLPTPNTGISPNGHGRRGGRPGNGSQSGASIDAIAPALADTWGSYGPAVGRWEHIVARPAPAPTEPGTKGQPRLSPLFVEWLMGLSAGWVTDYLPRNSALRVLGNGVVPQQAAAALQLLGVSA